MAMIDKIIQSTITGDLTFPAAAGFGIVMLVKEFDEFDTTVPFLNNESRHRSYASLDAVVTDGWGSDSDVYAAAKRLFAQNPNPGQFVLGRKDSGDAGWPEALTAIHDEYSGWYGLTIVEESDWTTSTRKTNLQAIAGWVETKSRIFAHATADEGCINYTRVASAGYTIGGTAGTIAAWAAVSDGAFGISIDGAAAVQITALDFSTPVTTLSEVATVIDTALTGATCTVVGTRLKIASDTVDSTSSITITAPSGGGTDITVATLFNLAAGTVVLGYDAGSTPGTDDLFTYFGNLALKRTIIMYNPQEQDAQHITPAACEWFAVGALAEGFPFQPASQTFAYKTITGVTPIEANETILDFVFDPQGATPRSGNIYTRIKGINVLYKGRMTDGTPLDVVRGTDWLNDLIQTKLWGLATRSSAGERKVPANNPGIATSENELRAALSEASVWFIDSDTISITIPDITEISETNRAARKLDKIEWSARLQGAFEEWVIQGVTYA